MTRPASDEDDPFVSAANRQCGGDSRAEDNGGEAPLAEK